MYNDLACFPPSRRPEIPPPHTHPPIVTVARLSEKSLTGALGGWGRWAVLLRRWDICLSGTGPTRAVRTCPGKIHRADASTLKGRFAAMLCARLVGGNAGCSSHPHRAEAAIKGLWKREGATREQKFNRDLPRWALRCWCANQRREGTAPAARILILRGFYSGFFYFPRISEVEPPPANVDIYICRYARR